MSKLTLSDVVSGNSSTVLSTINANSLATETAMEKTLSRDGTSPNHMDASLDMNSNRVLNLPEPVNGSEPLRLQDASTLNGGGTIQAYPQASYVVVGASSDLTNERVLTAGTAITFVDGGAGSTLTINSSGLSDGDKGDITVSASGATWTIDSGVVTTTKMGGDVTTAGKALLDDADASAQRTTLGLTSLATTTPGANVATFLATPSSANLASALTDETGTGAAVFANTPTLVTPVLGTPTSGTLTNCTGLPVASGISGLGANVATFLATPSSANLATAVTGETGSGALVFGTQPTITTSLTCIRPSGGAFTYVCGRSDEHGSSAGLFNFTATGRDSTPSNQDYGQWGMVAQTNTAGSEDGYFYFGTYRAGALADRVYVGGGVYHPSATGGDKGNNTVNFGAVYDDNTLLTDYVFDKYLDKISEYSPRVQEKFDALDGSMFSIDKYSQHWKENGRLYDMPDLNDCVDGIVKEHSLGSLIQKLMQTVELQAIHISELNDRIKKLEQND